MAKRRVLPPKQLFPLNLEKKYRSKLRELVSFMSSQVKEKLAPQIPNLIYSLSSSRNFSIKKDSYSEDLDRVLSDISTAIGRRYTQRQMLSLAQDVAESTQQFNKAQIIKQFDRVLGINPFQFKSESWLRDEMALFTKTNVTLISSLRDDYLKKVEINLNQAVQTGLTSRSLASEIKANFYDQLAETTDNVDARAELIARDQLSKFNGQLTKLRQEDIGVTSYEWSTAGDERVREDHKILEGKIFKWDSPPAVGHPGEDYNCRCVAIPIFKGTTQEEALDDLLNRRS